MIAGTSRMHESFVVSSDTTRELRDFVPMIQTSEARPEMYNMLVSRVTVILFCVSIEIPNSFLVSDFKPQDSK